jgi:predicted dehydrogenase
VSDQYTWAKYNKVDAMTKQVGIAILGCGYWGINYVRVFSELPESRVVAVCDQRTERLQEVGRRFPGMQLITETEDVLGLDGVDAVVVCTPATTHYNVTRRCLEMGKHILVEKPITTTATDAEALTTLAESEGLILMVGHTFLYNPGVKKLKEYIKQGDVGRLYYLYARRTNLGPIRRDVNALWDLAPHDVSIFNYLLDSTPKWVSAVGAKVLRNHREDVGFISLGYQSNIVGHIHVSWADAYKVREVVVVGSDKRVVFNDLNPFERVRAYEKGVTLMEPEASSYGEYQFLMREGDIISPRVEVSEPLKNQCSHFLECVTHGTRPLTGGWEGQEVVRVMEAIDRSIERNGAPVDVE